MRHANSSFITHSPQTTAIRDACMLNEMVHWEICKMSVIMPYWYVYTGRTSVDQTLSLKRWHSPFSWARWPWHCSSNLEHPCYCQELRSILYISLTARCMHVTSWGSWCLCVWPAAGFIWLIMSPKTHLGPREPWPQFWFWWDIMLLDWRQHFVALRTSATWTCLAVLPTCSTASAMNSAGL